MLNMIQIDLDGQKVDIEEGTTLGALLTERPPDCSVAIIRPGEGESAVTGNLRVYTSAGEIIVEIAEGASDLFSSGPLADFLSDKTKNLLDLKWTDRQAASFGTFSSDFIPAKKSHSYERGDVILGCGGYDPKNSHITFSKMRHSADHGAAAGGGLIGRVVTGKGIPNHWSAGDKITNIERVINRADISNSFTTTDADFVLEDGMQIISYVRAVAEGYSDRDVNTATAESVEHLLLSLSDNIFQVGLATSTHIKDDRMKMTDVPSELKKSRLEGTITARTSGKSRGSIYIYTNDIPGSPAHTVVGQVEHGIELVKLVSDNEKFNIQITPRQFDLLGIATDRAKEIAKERGIKLSIDNDDNDRVVIKQTPATTLEVLAAGMAELRTVPLSNVVDIRLSDDSAPKTCKIFREITGLKWHKIGGMPLLFNFEDVFLFNPKIDRKTKINLENTPTDIVPANILAMTNDSRKGTGLVGVRTSDNSEFGPTSEPFEGTNIIGEVIDVNKLDSLKEGELIYIREVPL